ncbi:hypothetical protein CFIO01_03553 [Colletotrichum fioriniae PJ7]|uniref:Secreted protein n=1 Tax=Colletotrichum fioriniae PJ7 TaxID=1445577 RepID=A0A010QHD7_9PEZI|nr:hypothetical protein CFIO01_03553 [Colletotrichum fioriniae PJ7]
MRYSLNIIALAALASAAPTTTAPMDFDAIMGAAAPTLTGPPVLATGQTGVYNAAAASSSAAAAVTGVASASATQSIAAHPCAVQPDGYGTQVQPDTVDAFQSFAQFHKEAQSAANPSGYANTFKDLSAAVNANSYLGLYTLKSYDVAACAAKCDATNLCTGINIYVERDPSINPSGCSCTNPASISNYKCTLWGSGVDKAAAVNTGQTRDGFQVVITGSNGYEKTNTTTPTTPSGWTNPQGCGGVVHSHPSTCMGQKFFPGPFDASLCATYAAAQNAQNSKSVGLSSWASFLGYSPLKCNFFNAFMVKQNGIAKGTYCSLFTQQYNPSAASYTPSFSAGFSWSIESSWSFCSK